MWLADIHMDRNRLVDAQVTVARTMSRHSFQGRNANPAEAMAAIAAAIHTAAARFESRAGNCPAGKTPREASESSPIEAKCTPSNPHPTGSRTAVAEIKLSSGR